MSKALDNVSKANSIPLQTGFASQYITTDGSDSTDMSWSVVDEYPVQTGLGGRYLQTDGTTVSWELAFPLQTGHGGKYLQTDGTNVTWELAFPLQTGHVGKYLRTDGTNTYWDDPRTLPNQAGKIGNELTTLGVDDNSAQWSPVRNNPISISTSYSIPAGVNASVVAPVLEAGVTITIATGSTLTVI